MVSDSCDTTPAFLHVHIQLAAAPIEPREDFTGIKEKDDTGDP